MLHFQKKSCNGLEINRVFVKLANEYEGDIVHEDPGEHDTRDQIDQATNDYCEEHPEEPECKDLAKDVENSHETVWIIILVFILFASIGFITCITCLVCKKNVFP